ncbi:DUF1045 domain-containing protein [Paracoccus marinaquae]|uniref:DUF1045 domain-containing protein n=1 Tax=Paracoccus marinaquae TaxID=2841926 RepID=A0ABS6AGE2_9RHOB|nr:DUF1045 domain-containing protein [Paracoccus marinaquae]MBU3028704.1 DUF1045 domain-containing protein [Paracoccus marinaquae]
MGEWRRYAIYYTATGPLAEFGAVWLGWDIARSRAFEVRPARIEALTRSPRRYGFHATLKPPFRLAPDSSEAALLADLRDLAAALEPVSLQGGLQLALLDGFPALVPSAPAPGLHDLAARIVRDLDQHRAPPTPEERARRAPERLTAAQRALLDRWGYPWVMDQFRFHMTLGDRMTAPEAEILLATLAPELAPLLPDPHPVDAITLAGEDEAGSFHQIARVPLG